MTAFAQRPPQVDRPRLPEKPFAAIYRAFPGQTEPVRLAIESLTGAGKSVSVPLVADLLDRQARRDVPPLTVWRGEPMPAPLPMTSPVQMPVTDATIAEQRLCAIRARLAAKIAKPRQGISAAEEAQYQRDKARLVRGWDYLPSSNWYERECGS